MAFGNSTDTIPKQKLPKQNFINFKAGLNIGDEIGLTGQCEYENSSWGKIILHTEMAAYYKSMLIFDAGFGYGYPFLQYNGKTIYFVSYITFSEIGLMETNFAGPSAMFELEYKKEWTNISMHLAPYFRQQILYDVQDYDYNRNLSHYILNYSFGLNLAISIHLPVGKRSLN